MRLLILFLALAALLRGQPEPASATTPVRPEQARTALGPGDAVILGLIEGITEFLPISSTGHLIIGMHALGLDSDAPLLDENGAIRWAHPPGDGEAGEPLTMRGAAETYAVVIQFGAIAAVAGLYWQAIWSMILGVLGRDSRGLRLAIQLIVAFLPAALIGFLAHDWIEENLFSPEAVIVAQVVGAGLMLWAERWRRKRGTAGQELTTRAALGIGVMQCAALWPGTSRSMMTIVGGYFAGLEPRKAAEFSFLLGFVTLSAAACYKTLQGGREMVEVFGLPNILLGAAVAAISAAVAVKFLVSYLTRHGLGVFALYRLLTAAAIAAWIWT